MHLYGGQWHNNPGDAFCELWESINGAGSWDANPLVWVVEFKRIEQEAEKHDGKI